MDEPPPFLAQCPRWTTRTSSSISSSASLRSSPPSPAPPSSAHVGTTSSPTHSSSAASANTTRNPPLIGFFQEGSGVVRGFHPVLDPPDRIPAERFSVPKSRSPKELWDFMGCRHGLAVVVDVSRREIVVWDPLTGQQHRVTFPPCLDANDKGNYWHVAVVCVDAEVGHVHGDCFSRPFKLVLIWEVGYTQAFGCLYESTSGVWGNICWTAITGGPGGLLSRPSILVGDALCWLLCGGDVLVFDFEM